MVARDFDVIVIGSGFGGAVMTCRLAERGYRVCLLERGRRYGMHEFPRRMDDVRQRLFWDPRERRYGFVEFRDHADSDVTTVCASGLGGGSLIYANVLMRMPADFFAGWPCGIDRAVLDPYYDRALEMLEAAPYPYESSAYYAETPKTAAMKAAAARLRPSADAVGAPQFELPALGIRFTGDFPGQQSTNAHGALQSRCNKCGECVLGCNLHAKNTLDLNYLHRARSGGGNGNGNGFVAADIRTDAGVDEIRPLAGGGYTVQYHPAAEPARGVTLTARKVVLSAGSIGSTTLLLQMRRRGLLPHLSDRLGQAWCPNGDLEGTIIGATGDADPSSGPTITSAIAYRFEPFPDGFPHGVFIQDAGLPPFVGWYLAGKAPSPRSFVHALRLALRFLFRGGGRRLPPNLSGHLAGLLDEDDFVRRSFLLLGMGRDRSDGRIELRDDGEAVVRWNIEASRLHYERVRREMASIAEAMGGRFVDNPLTYLDKVIAVHPLGGCSMADTASAGVVDERAETFGHPGLHVVDASIIPTSLGPNPSLTIAALAERVAERFEL